MRAPYRQIITRVVPRPYLAGVRSNKRVRISVNYVVTVVVGCALRSKTRYGTVSVLLKMITTTPRPFSVRSVQLAGKSLINYPATILDLHVRLTPGGNGAYNSKSYHQPYRAPPL
jgi:hypothetical protein